MMRIHVENFSRHADAEIRPLVEFAATFFPHVSGLVTMIVKNSRAYTRGICYPHKRMCTVWIGKESYPLTFTRMTYFRHANHSSVKTLVQNTWQEAFMSLAAHELTHITKSNRRMRRSRQEIDAWNRSVDILAEYRLEKNQAEIGARMIQLRDRSECIERAAQKKNQPEAKLAHCHALMLRWRRKQKLANTKISKLKTRIKYYEKKVRRQQDEI